MASYDLGDLVPLGVSVTDSAGTAANADAVTVTVTLPDGTTSAPSVTNPTTGSYNADYQPTIAGRYTVRWVATGTNASAFSDEFTVRDLTHLPVVSYSDALAHLNIPSTSVDEEELRRYIDAAQDLAETYVGAILGRQVFTSETYDGGQSVITLRNPRAITVQSVYENGVLVPSTGYYLDYTGQRLYRTTSGVFTGTAQSYWIPGVQVISVSYTAGFIVTPPSVQQGVLEILRHLWSTQRGAVNVMSKQDEYVQGSGYSIPRRAMELLDMASLPGIA